MRNIREYIEDIVGVDRSYIDRYLTFIETCTLRVVDTKIHLDAHHILPRCLFPDFIDKRANPWNIIRLTPDEHYIAHYYLYRLFPEVHKLAYSWWRFNHKRRVGDTIDDNILITYASEAAEARNRWLDSLRGKPLTEEHRRRIGIANKGKKMAPNVGIAVGRANHLRVHSKETRDRLSNSLRGKVRSPESIERYRRSKLGKRFYNNGTEQRLLNPEDVPEGFVPGRLRTPNKN